MSHLYYGSGLVDNIADHSGGWTCYTSIYSQYLVIYKVVCYLHERGQILFWIYLLCSSAIKARLCFTYLSFPDLPKHSKRMALASVCGYTPIRWHEAIVIGLLENLDDVAKQTVETWLCAAGQGWERRRPSLRPASTVARTSSTMWGIQISLIIICTTIKEIYQASLTLPPFSHPATNLGRVLVDDQVELRSVICFFHLQDKSDLQSSTSFPFVMSFKSFPGKGGEHELRPRHNHPWLQVPGRKCEQRQSLSYQKTKPVKSQSIKLKI